MGATGWSRDGGATMESGATPTVLTLSFVRRGGVRQSRSVESLRSGAASEGPLRSRYVRSPSRSATTSRM